MIALVFTYYRTDHLLAYNSALTTTAKNAVSTANSVSKLYSATAAALREFAERSPSVFKEAGAAYLRVAGTESANKNANKVIERAYSKVSPMNSRLAIAMKKASAAEKLLFSDKAFIKFKLTTEFEVKEKMETEACKFANKKSDLSDDSLQKTASLLADAKYQSGLYANIFTSEDLNSHFKSEYQNSLIFAKELWNKAGASSKAAMNKTADAADAWSRCYLARAMLYSASP